MLRTRAEPIGIDLVVGDLGADLDPAAAFGVLVSQPGSSGRLLPVDALEALAGAGARRRRARRGRRRPAVAPAAGRPPGAWGADIAVGSAQRFGVPMGFGGPHAAFLATRDAFARALPGRLVGVSTDTAGRPALRLALQTREQHIRREKATSNICTAQVLLANIAGLYAVWHGPDGLARIAERVHRLTSMLAAGLRGGGVEVVGDTWFDTLTVRVPGPGRRRAWPRARQRGIELRPVDADTVGISPRRDHHPRHRGRRVVGVRRGAPRSRRSTPPPPTASRPTSRRTGEVLTHTVFHRYRSEHEMLRYLRRLADRDLALDRTMIPLGSCTMKLNATAEMIPITWPELAHIHPFAPESATRGYVAMIDELEAMLVAITGYDAVSLQPNAGSQGELAGLLAIRAYHRSRGDDERTVCLIPSSAHGTNAASAVMAGMDVVVVACDDRGNVDLDDLRAEGGRRRRAPRRRHGHLPVDPRRLRGRHHRRCAPSSTTTAARCTSTAPTSTPWSAWPSPAASAPTSAT